MGSLRIQRYLCYSTSGSTGDPGCCSSGIRILAGTRDCTKIGTVDFSLLVREDGTEDDFTLVQAFRGESGADIVAALDCLSVHDMVSLGR